MTLSLIVDIAEDNWKRALPDLDRLANVAALQAIVDAAPDYAQSESLIEIGIVFADDDFVQSLNKQYRSQNKPTNVLSFPLTQNHAGANAPILLGDVVLALQTIVREASEAGKTLAAHTQHLIVHGVLHLLGHDHEAENEAKAMESLEIEILDAIGVADPYTVTLDAD